MSSNELERQIRMRDETIERQRAQIDQMIEKLKHSEKREQEAMSQSSELKAKCQGFMEEIQ